MASFAGPNSSNELEMCKCLDAEVVCEVLLSQIFQDLFHMIFFAVLTQQFDDRDQSVYTILKIFEGLVILVLFLKSYQVEYSNTMWCC